MTAPRPLITLQSLLVLTICVLLFGMGQFHRAAGAIVSPVWQVEFVLTADQLGLVISVIFLVNIVAQGFVGSLLDKFGPRIIISLFMVVLAIGTVSAIWATGFYGLVISRIILGTGLSAGGVGMFMLLARNFPSDQFGFLNGLMVSLGGVGGLAATYPLAFVIAQFGWQNVFVGLSVFTLALAALVFLAVEGEPKDKPLTRAEKITFLSLLKTKKLQPILVMGFVTWAPITAITGLWGGPYFTAVHGLSLEETGLFQMLFFVATMSSALTFGLIDRSARIPRYWVILAASAISIACLLALTFVDGLALWPAAVLLFGMIFAQQYYVPLMAQMRSVVPEAAIGRASSLYIMIAVAAIPIFQTLMGIVIRLSEHLSAEQSYQLAFGLMAVMIFAPTVVFSVFAQRSE